MAKYTERQVHEFSILVTKCGGVAPVSGLLDMIEQLGGVETARAVLGSVEETNDLEACPGLSGWPQASRPPVLRREVRSPRLQKPVRVQRRS